MLENKDDPTIRKCVRMDVLDYLKKNNCSIQTPATSPDQEERHGTSVELLVFAHLIGCSIYVWNADVAKEMFGDTKWACLKKFPDDHPTLFLEVEGGCHYNVCLM